MKHYKLNGEIYNSLFSLKRALKNVSFPQNITDEMLIDLGVEIMLVDIVEPTLKELKAGRIAYLKARRDALEVEPLEYKGKLYDYDNKARERLSIARTALEDMGGEGTQAWTTYDNSVVILSLEDFKALNRVAALRSSNLHNKYNKMKEEVAKAETPGDLERIDY